MKAAPQAAHAGTFLVEREWARSSVGTGAGPRLVHWPWIYLKSWFEVAARPASGFRRILEPVDHGPVICTVAAFRLVPWAVAAIAIVAAWLSGSPLRVGSLGWLASSVDGGMIHALSRWLFWLAPLLVLLTYVGAGLMCHLALALTGGARRSVGASMRAFGLGALPGLSLMYVLEPVLVLHAVMPEVWLWLLIGSALAVLIGATRAFSQTHEIAWWRALVVVLPAVCVVVACVGARTILELERLPLQLTPTQAVDGTRPPQGPPLEIDDTYYVDP